MDTEERIRKIEDRNRRVEEDKAWETSTTRRMLLAIFTYLAIALYLSAIEISRPWVNAIVPTAGFLISSLTLPIFRMVWLKIRKGKSS